MKNYQTIILGKFGNLEVLEAAFPWGVLEVAFPWGVLQILGSAAYRLRTKQHLLELPELWKTKFEVYAIPEQCWWVNPSFGLTSRGLYL